MTERFANPVPQFEKASGLNANGWLVFFEPGTTRPKDVYSDQSMTINAGNEIQLDGAGRVPNIWLNGSYKVRHHEDDGTGSGIGAQIWERDPVFGVASFSGDEAATGNDDWVLQSNGVTWVATRLDNALTDGIGDASQATTGRTALQAAFSSNPGGDLPIADGGTGASTSTAAVDNLGLRDGTNYVTGRKNLFRNGEFLIDQRGLADGAGYTSNGYAMDMVYHERTGSTMTVTRQAFTVGQTDVPLEPRYYGRAVVTTLAGAGNFARLRFDVPDIRTSIGNKSLGIQLKADAAKSVTIEGFQQFGTGGSAEVNTLNVTKINLTTSWQFFPWTHLFPSISGKTIGTSPGLIFGVYIWLDAGSTFNSRTDTLGQQSGTFDFANIQIERGSVSTEFEKLSEDQYLDQCLPFYEESDALVSTIGNSPMSGASNVYRDFITFKKAKHATPTMTILDNLGASGVLTSISQFGGVVANGVAATSNAQKLGFRLDAQIGTSSAGISFNYKAESNP